MTMVASALADGDRINGGCQATILNFNVKGGEKLGHGVSTLGDYVRLSVKGKCPLSRLPC